MKCLGDAPKRSVPEGRYDGSSLAEQHYAYLTWSLMTRFEPGDRYTTSIFIVVYVRGFGLNLFLMANTFSCLNIHCVFSTKERVPVLVPELRERLWSYMGGIAKENGIFPKCIGGVADHVHLLLALPTTMGIAKAMQLIKTGSPGWIHHTFPELRNFAWQQGYGAFSVGISQLPETIQYIEEQLEHHRTRTFKDEYLAFLKRHGGNLDDKYLWD